MTFNDQPAAGLDKYPWARDTVVCDGLLPWVDALLPPGSRLSDQLNRFATSGFDHISLTVAAGQDNALSALNRLGEIHREIAATRGAVRPVRTHEEVLAAKADRCLSVSFHFQTCTPFADGLDLVDAFLAAGVQRALLAYNEANMFADGCHEPRNAGLSAAGRQLVTRMDQAGMVVDLSHCGERTSFDALELPLKHAPVFSHSNARALFDHERNITDQQIRLCAERGGYIGINGVGMFLGVPSHEIPAAMARNAAHIAEIAGADRVALGLDFMYLEGSDYGFYFAAKDRWPRGYPAPPWDFLQPEQLADFVDELVAVGFEGGEIAGILGENYLRHNFR